MPRRSKKLTRYAFIDSQNLNLGTQRMGWKMDWRKFRELLSKKYNVTHAYMFIGYMSENESLYEYMHDLGYLIVLKPTVDVAASPEAGKDEKTAVKGNVDADLVLYAMKELPNYDQAIIVTGDGDFVGLIEYLEGIKKLGTIMTPNWQYSSLFKPFEKKITRLDQSRKQLEYKSRKRTSPKATKTKHSQ